MTSYFKCLLIFSGLGISLSTYGQLSIDAQFRPRFELRNGYTTLPEETDEPVFITSQRTRLNIDYKYDDHLSAYFSAQDIRVWGESEPLEQDADLNIYQAWLRFAPSNNLAFKLGRQELAYDNYKLMAIADWRQQGRVHDASLIQLQSNDSTWKADVAIAINQDSEVLFQDLYDGRNYKNLHLLHLNKKYSSSNVSFILVNIGQQLSDTSVIYTQTFGFYAKKNLGRFSLNGHYYYQSGKRTEDTNVNAYWIASEANFNLNKTMRLAIGADLLSGTPTENVSNPNADTENFIPLFALRHRYFGAQDMFYFNGFNVPVGLRDFYLRVAKQVGAKSNLRLDTHSFSTFTSLEDGNGGSFDKNLGLEFDLFYTYRYNDHFSIHGGYTQFFATDTMVALKQRGEKEELTNFFYLTLDFRPRLFYKD
ncbi:MAG: alginate export family protein [Bacteroidota bacterium]